ncbi:hypothetical protein LOD99_9119 [Oopsacas minuta]|uniref:Tc1-like transposase DDE domain-containing protein n=1 Tax=Oopsacas minuta TaxID=111878 RepID=A0AAV7JEG1_9METZ|nr:hypothetical protein LOD99_9119 [Oopsacas minuta]
MLKIPRERRMFITRAIKRYLETGNVKDRGRTGRPCSVVTPKVRKAVREQIQRCPRRSMRKMASVLKISHRSVQRIVKNQLGMRSFKRKTVYFLSSKIMGKRLDGAPAHISKVNQAWLKENIPDFIPKDEWPPYSPDLNPMDYSIWSISETKACAKAHTNVESLKVSLRREWAKYLKKHCVLRLRPSLAD